MCHPHDEVSLGFCGGTYPVGTHICLVYRDEQERRRVVRRFVESGLIDNEQVFYFADTPEKPAVDSWLREMDIDASVYTQAPHLELEQALATYCPDGSFDQCNMTATIRQAYTASKSSGFAHSRVSGEMSWALHGLPGSERLIDYEAMINEVVKTHPITAMCQYDANRFDGETVFRAMQVHPYMVMGGQIVRNPYYEI